MFGKKSVEITETAWNKAFDNISLFNENSNFSATFSITMAGSVQEIIAKVAGLNSKSQSWDSSEQAWKYGYYNAKYGIVWGIDETQKCYDTGRSGGVICHEYIKTAFEFKDKFNKVTKNGKIYKYTPEGQITPKNCGAEIAFNNDGKISNISFDVGNPDLIAKIEFSNYGTTVVDNYPQNIRENRIATQENITTQTMESAKVNLDQNKEYYFAICFDQFSSYDKLTKSVNKINVKNGSDQTFIISNEITFLQNINKLDDIHEDDYTITKDGSQNYLSEATMITDTSKKPVKNDVYIVGIKATANVTNAKLVLSLS